MVPFATSVGLVRHSVPFLLLMVPLPCNIVSVYICGVGTPLVEDDALLHLHALVLAWRIIFEKGFTKPCKMTSRRWSMVVVVQYYIFR